MYKRQSSPDCEVQAFSFDKAFGLQFHVEQTNKTVPEWACVPEYKSALEKTLGENALEKIKRDVEQNLNLFNNSDKTIYENFKKNNLKQLSLNTMLVHRDHIIQN